MENKGGRGLRVRYKQNFVGEIFFYLRQNDNSLALRVLGKWLSSVRNFKPHHAFSIEKLVLWEELVNSDRCAKSQEALKISRRVPENSWIIYFRVYGLSRNLSRFYNEKNSIFYLNTNFRRHLVMINWFIQAVDNFFDYFRIFFVKKN